MDQGDIIAPAGRKRLSPSRYKERPMTKRTACLHPARPRQGQPSALTVLNERAAAQNNELEPGAVS
jgi:hypothetical protein